MKAPPPVTVILTVLNDREGIREALEALIEQSHPDFTIVVVDGGSTDGTCDVLEEYAARDSRIQWKRCPGTNIAQGRNIAIETAPTDIVATTDAGCRPARDWLELLVKPLIENPEVGATSGFIRVRPETTFELFAGLLTTPGNLQPEDPRHCALSGRNSAFRKAVWRQAGGYPEWLYTAEDRLFREKLYCMGVKVVQVPRAVVDWRPRPNLRRHARMMYLYGVGAGHIGEPLRGHWYNIRNYLTLALLAAAGVFVPHAWLLLGAVVGYFYYGLHRPRVAEVKRSTGLPSAELYVPVILTVNRLFYTLGVLKGRYDLARRKEFRHRLVSYMRPCAQRA